MGSQLSITTGNVFPCQDQILPKDRAKAAILGAFVADAATMPLHWIYDQQVVESKVKNSFGDNKGPEFFSPPSCPFYDYALGRQSPYGDEAIPLMLSLVEKGHFDVDDAREVSFQFCKSYDGRLNRVMQRFLEQRKLGKDWQECCVDDDLQFLALMKVPIIVARYAGNPSMIEKLEQAVSIHQTNEKVLAAARLVARLLEKIVLGSTVLEALRWAKSIRTLPPEEKVYLDEICEKTSDPFSVAAEKYGLNGHLPGCLKGGLHALKTFRGFEVAVRANIVAAGDNVARAWLIGSFLAAEQGMHAIPSSWRAQTTMFDKLEAMSVSIVGSNTYLDKQVERACSLPSLF